MQRMVVHKVGVGSLGKLIGTWFAIVAFVIGVIAAVATTISVFEQNDFSVLAGVGYAVLISAGWVLLYPLVMFAVGWLQGAILAVVFNFVISGSGGLSLHVESSPLDAPVKK